EPDDAGHFWMTSDAGIGRYDRRALDAVAAGRRARLAPLLLTEADGMPSAEGCTGQPGGARAPDGRLWFPTIAGVAIVDPARVARNERPPPVRIEEVVADGVVLDGAPEQLPAGTRNVAFRYTALSLVHSEANRFRYRLDGVDEGWVEAEARRGVSYANLPPGRYTFRVQGSNNDGVWNAAGAALTFEIPPLWWQTAWFRLLVGLAAAGLLFGGFRFWQTRATRRRLEALVAERTVDLRVAQERTTAQAARLAAQ